MPGNSGSKALPGAAHIQSSIAEACSSTSVTGRKLAFHDALPDIFRDLAAREYHIKFDPGAVAPHCLCRRCGISHNH
jgi:hypothetical protein